jgi:outer membrane protein assembly factor BamD
MRCLILAGGAALAACSGGFKLTRYPTTDTLFQAAMEQFRRKKWDNAVQAFEKLTFDLPARDTLLPLAHFYLARAYAERGDHLLAAQAFTRMSESFATDTLADDAMFQAGREYSKLWRKPVLDSQYGIDALTTYETLLSLYPDSDLRERTTQEIQRIQEWFATKDYENAMYYFRRKAYDPALIYFRDVVRLYPETRHAREAYLRMAEAYDAIRWKEDKDEVCRTLHERYPTDREVPEVCGPAPKADTAKRDSL